MKRKLLSIVLALSMLVSVMAVLPIGTLASGGVTPYQSGEEAAPKPIGTGAVADPYRIYTAEQLSAFSAIAATEPTACAKLCADVTYNAGYAFSADIDTGLVAVTKGETVGYIGTGIKGMSGGNTSFDNNASAFGKWYVKTGDSYSQAGASPFSLTAYTPIGTSSVPYKGVFDGAGHKISGIYYVGAATSVGLFSSIGAGAEIKDLTVKASLIMSSADKVGAIAGTMLNTEALNLQIKSCRNEDSVVVGKSYVGGILGYQDTASSGYIKYTIVSDCENSGYVMSSSYSAGIVAYSNRGNIKSSTFGAMKNTGTVYSSGRNVGGIVSSFVNGDSIANMLNEGEIYGANYVAGIAASSNRALKNCINAGSVIGATYISGIVTNSAENNAVTGCANVGKITATVAYAAGITAGVANAQRAPQISNCYNAGEICADVRAAGIVCKMIYTEWQVEIKDGENNVTGAETKSVKTTVKNCVSTDTVRALTIEADPICPAFDVGADMPVGCSTVSYHDFKIGAVAYLLQDSFGQRIGKDAYPIPTADSSYNVFRHSNSDGFYFYTNSKNSSHIMHRNEDGDCYCDVCEYTFPDAHTNADGDCVCDICGEYAYSSHLFTGGGKCTECGTFKDGKTAIGAGNLVISDVIKLGIFMELSDDIVKTVGSYAKIKIRTTTLEIKVSDAQRVGKYYVFYVPLRANQLSDTVTVQICGTAVGALAVHSYSAKEYLEDVKKQDSVKEITDAIRLWADAAMRADGIDADEELKDGLELGQIQLPSDKKLKIEGDVEGLVHHSTGVSLTESLTVRHIFSGTDGVIFLIDGKAVSPIALPLDRYAIDISGIDPFDLDKEYTVTAIKGRESYSVTYSVFADICRKLEGGYDNENDVALYRAVCNYIAASKQIKGTIVYNMNGGSIETSIKDFGYFDQTVLPTEGMSYMIGGEAQKFLGWFSDPECTVPVTQVPRHTVGEFEVYAKWRIDYLSNGYSADDSISDGSQELVSKDGVVYSTPSGSGATFVVSGGHLNWSASEGGSSVMAVSAIGNFLSGLPSDGYASFVITFKDIAMATSFCLKAADSYFEVFTTTEDSRVLFGQTELQAAADGSFTVRLVLDVAKSLITAYSENGKEIGSVLLSKDYGNGCKVSFYMHKELIGDTLFELVSKSGGSISIDKVSVERGHLLKKHAIEYVLNGGVFKDGYTPPEVYADEGESTKLPSAECITRDDGIFVGWYADEELTVPIDSVAPYNIGIVKVYAKWRMIFIDIDYNAENAIDPDKHESTVASVGNGLSYGIYGSKTLEDGSTVPGVGIYDVIEDENGRKFLLVATEVNGSQITGTVANKLSDIESDDLSISFKITLSANGMDYVSDAEGATNIINESNMTSTYLRLRGPVDGKNTDLLYVFTVAAGGSVKMGEKEIAVINTKRAEPVTLRIVADFKNGLLIAYDEDGNIVESVGFSIPSGTGAATHEDLLRLMTTECCCLRLNTDNSAFRLYELKIVEGNAFAK